jgi:hypothetical protein
MAPLSYPRAEILALCEKYGPVLHVPAGLNGERVMAAIASNESSLGANCEPRYEPAYDRGGVYDEGDQAPLIDIYGRAAACSYGPWQVLLLNAAPMTPFEVNADAEAGAKAFVQFFNSYVMARKKAKTLAQIGQVYNSGHIAATPSPGVARYIVELEKAYKAAFPATVGAK